MQIDLRKVSIQEVVQYSKHLKECHGYYDRGEEGVRGMSGRLNIRPKFQREFIYKDAQREAVVTTIRNSFPLNTMYWVVNKDGSYEVMDGQQRLISLCQYATNKFSVDEIYFHNLTEDQQEQFLNYELMVYFCEGTESEKLDWFRIINIAGEKLTDQELRNAVYCGPWLSDAKRYFSKTGCPAHKIADKYLKGSTIRQDYLETVIKWISNNNIEEYMAENQNKDDALDLWQYFQDVIKWVESTFIVYRREMKGLPFGVLYNEFKDAQYDPNKIEEAIKNLMRDEDVDKKSGIYPYILTGNEKYLNIRSFSDNQKRETYERQQGVCIRCGGQFEIEDMEADHITPWSKGGKTSVENCQMLCLQCNRTKSDS